MKFFFLSLIGVLQMAHDSNLSEHSSQHIVWPHGSHTTFISFVKHVLQNFWSIKMLSLDSNSPVLSWTSFCRISFSCSSKAVTDCNRIFSTSRASTDILSSIKRLKADPLLDIVGNEDAAILPELILAAALLYWSFLSKKVESRRFQWNQFDVGLSFSNVITRA